MLPLLLLFSLLLLLRGHNHPGGGFSGGLVAAAAFVLYAFAFGAPEARRVLALQPHTLIGVGLLVAIGSAALPLFVNRPLMTGLWVEPSLNGSGSFHVGTPLVFDVGVYLVVIGVGLMIILPLVEE
jgi:multicomponent Na+:H+ antiporter subunit B